MSIESCRALKCHENENLKDTLSRSCVIYSDFLQMVAAQTQSFICSKCFSNPQDTSKFMSTTCDVSCSEKKRSPRFNKSILKPCMHWFCFISVRFGCFASSVPVGDDLVHPLTLYVLRRMALDGIRMPDGCYADGTWELKMHVTDLNRDVSLRVTGEIHVGGVMLKLVEKLGTHRKRIVNAFQKACNRC